jgi:hypothetical protein
VTGLLIPYIWKIRKRFGSGLFYYLSTAETEEKYERNVSIISGWDEFNAHISQMLNRTSSNG